MFKVNMALRLGFSQRLSRPTPRSYPVSGVQASGPVLAFVGKPHQQANDVASRAVGPRACTRTAPSTEISTPSGAEIILLPVRHGRAVGKSAIHLQIANHGESIYFIGIGEGQTPEPQSPG